MEMIEVLVEQEDHFLSMINQMEFNFGNPKNIT